MQDHIFYHIYPLGLVGARKRNDFKTTPTQHLKQLLPWLAHMQVLGCTALYLGPVFEATSHGYDTADYFQVDRRLGTKEQLRAVVTKAHDLGIQVILDGVFNHVGRDFWAFKDLRKKGKHSIYKDWFSHVDFTEKGQQGDGFTYANWQGHYQLVELNLHNPELRSHLFSAITDWIEQYDIDGLRLDAADVIDLDFLNTLSTFCKNKKPDFWLLGEVVSGDYREWVNPNMLDSVTNYDFHGPLYDSCNHRDFGHVARVLAHQYGPAGVYTNLKLYSFLDNHDVPRAASALHEPAHLFPLYLLLFTLPGIPAMYYGSEWGFEGNIEDGGHHELRPEVNLKQVDTLAKHPLLFDSIKRFTAVRAATPCLRNGNYEELFVGKEQFAFVRATETTVVICVVNTSKLVVSLAIPIDRYTAKHYMDLLNTGYTCAIKAGILRLDVPSCWGRVLAPLETA